MSTVIDQWADCHLIGEFRLNNVLLMKETFKLLYTRRNTLPAVSMITY